MIQSKKFDSKLWLEVHAQDRRYMYQDLVDNVLRPQMPMTNVVKLIGKPWSYRTYNSKLYNKKCLQYDMGISGTMMMYSYDMVVCPDQSGNRMQEACLVGGWCFRPFDQGKTVYIED